MRLALVLGILVLLCAGFGTAFAQSPNIGSVVGTVNLGTEGAAYESGYDSGNGLVYVVNSVAGTLSEVSGTTVVGTITGSGLGGYNPLNVVYDNDSGNLYVATLLGVTVISGGTPIATLSTGLNTFGIAYDHTNGYVYSGSVNSNTVSVIAGTTITATISGVNGPYSIAYDPANNYVYVANFFANTLSVVSGTSIIGTINLPGQPNGLAYDSSSQELYVSMEGTSTAIVSGTTLLGTIPGVGGNGIAYDSGNGFLYACCDSSSNLGVISGSSVIGSIPVGGYGGYGVTYDPNDGFVYVVNGGTESQGSQVTVYVVSTPTTSAALTVTPNVVPYVPFTGSNYNAIPGAEVKSSGFPPSPASCDPLHGSPTVTCTVVDLMFSQYSLQETLSGYSQFGYIPLKGWEFPVWVLPNGSLDIPNFQVTVTQYGPGVYNIFAFERVQTNGQPAVDYATSYVEQLVNFTGTQTFTLSAQVPTTTSVSCLPSSIVPSESTHCMATVAGSSPTGVVDFTTGGTGSLTPSSASCTLVSGGCSVTFAGGAEGSITVTAAYQGDSSNSASSASTLVQVVSTVELSASDGATVCPIAPLYGSWDAATNTCTVSQSESIPTGITLQIDSGVTVALTGTGSVQVNGVLDNYGIISVAGGTVQGGGVLSFGGGSPTPSLNNYGTISNQGLLRGQGVLTNEVGGLITNNGCGTDKILATCISIDGTWINNGVIDNGLSGGLFVGTGGYPAYLENDGTINSMGAFNTEVGSSSGGVAFANYGTVNLQSGSTYVFGQAVNEQSGTMVVSAGAQMSVDGGALSNYGLVQNGGSANTQNGGNFVNEPSGTLQNTGSGGSGSGLVVQGTLTNEGTLVNQGQFNVKGTFDDASVTSVFTNYGTLDIQSGWVHFFGSVTNEKEGTILTSGGGFGVIGTLANYGVVNGVFGINGTFTNYNTVDIPGNGYMHSTPYGCANDVDNYPGTFDNQGSLNVAAGGNVDDSGAVVNEATGVISNSGSFGVNAGTCNGVSHAGTLTNMGMISSSGSFDVGGTMTNSGTFDSAGLGSDPGSTITNSGVVDLSGGSGGLFGTLTNEKSGTFTIESNEGDGVIGTLTNYGTITVYGNLGTKPQSIFPGFPCTLDNFGTINNHGAMPDGGVLINEATGVITNTGTGSNGGGIGVQNGSYNGYPIAGTLDNKGMINNQGDFFVGSTMTNEGTFDSGGNFGTSPGSSFTNSGTVDLSGNGGFGGALINQKGYVITIESSGSYCLGGTFTNDGALTDNGGLEIAQPGNCQPNSAGFFDNQGSVAVGGQLGVAGSLTNEKGGTFTIQAGASIGTSGTFTNYGSVANNGGMFVGPPGSNGPGSPGGFLDNYGGIVNQGNFGSQGSITNEAGATITNDAVGQNQGFSIVGGTLTNYGTLNNEGQTHLGVGGALTNYGLIYVTNTVSNCDNGGINIGGGNGGTLDNHATITSNEGCLVSGSGSVLTNEIGATISLTNQGSLVTPPASDGPITGLVNNYGAFFIDSSSGVYLLGIPNCNSVGVAFNNYGTLNNEGYFTLGCNSDPSSLVNSGTIQNTGTVDNYGTVDNQATGTIDNPGLILNECGAIYKSSGAFSGNPVHGNCPTSTTVASSASSLIPGTSVTLTGTVTDSSGTPSTPGGYLVWSDGGAGGTFSDGGSCALVPQASSTSGCSIAYTAPAAFTSLTITASYSGDDIHQQSSGSTTLAVAYRNCPNVPNGGGVNLKGADLEYCNLAGYNLSNDNLNGANLFGANLAGADLAGANLLNANLSMAYAPGANFIGANGNSADFAGGNFSGANFTEANLQSSNFTNANVSTANFTNANLFGANFSGANTTGANFSGANLHGATIGIPTYTATSLGGIAVDPNGNLFFVQTPSSTEADLYLRAAGATTPTEVFTLNVPSATGGAGISEIHFDAKGNVYFIALEVTPISQSLAEIDTQVYLLNAGNGYSATELTSATTEVPQPCCGSAITTGTFYSELGVDSAGDVFIGGSSYSQASGAQAVLMYIASGSSNVVTRAVLGTTTFAYAFGDSIVVNGQGDVFLVTSAPGGSIFEVTPTGTVTSLNTPAANIGVDASGDVFFFQRTFTNHQCGFVAQSTTITIGYFSASTLSTANPTPTIESQVTYSGYMALQGGDSDLFAVGSGGTVYYQLLTSLRTSCSSPLDFGAETLYALPLGSSAPNVLATTQPGGDVFYMAVSGSSFYYGDAFTGVIFRQT